MALDIKICGLKTSGTLAAALDGGASHVGFIFFPEEPAPCAARRRRRLRVAARGRASGSVAVNSSTRAIDDAGRGSSRRWCRTCCNRIGKETPERVAVKARYGLPVMRACRSRRLPISTRWRRFAAWPTASCSTLATGRLELPGGNGVAFDWSIFGKLDPEIDYLLGGGLNPRNVGEAVRIANPPGLDVSSGVESAPGVKNIGLIRDFLLPAAAPGAKGAQPAAISSPSTR